MEQIGTAVDRALAVKADGQAPCVMRPFQGPPTTLEECDRLRSWAVANPATNDPPATHDELAKHLRFLDAALPSRQVDHETGRMRFAVYYSMLAGYSNEALTFMSRTACTSLKWFPVVSECLEILREYRPHVSDQAIALMQCDRFTHDRFEEWIAALSNGGEVGDAPERWIEIALTRTLLRRLADGSLVVRDRYHGPRRVAVA